MQSKALMIGLYQQRHEWQLVILHIYLFLITCVIARSNPRTLLPTWREKLRGHYHVTMTCDNDFCVWRWYYPEPHSRVSQGACSNFTFKFKDFSRTFKVQKCYFQAPYTDMPTCWMPKLYWISKTVFSHVKLYYSNKCSYDKFVRVKYMYNLPL